MQREFCNLGRHVESYVSVSDYSFIQKNILSAYYVVGSVLSNGIQFVTIATKAKVVSQGSEVFLCQEKESRAVAVTENKRIIHYSSVVPPVCCPSHK